MNFILHLRLATGDVPSAASRGSGRRASGFTLLEVLVSITLISLCATFAYATMLSSNKTAVLNRLYTLAQEVARNQIDRIQCAAPYNPQFKVPQIPVELATGTTTKSVPLYVDPTTNATVVTANVITNVADLGNYNARSALVTVVYTFRGQTYRVQMNTIRTSDS